ncbi:MAG: hypothetical protein EBR82_05765 [Caulobacteraceae bacterium]|nr:hypothetical protein [Caulobacteraceae bacterium]
MSDIVCEREFNTTIDGVVRPILVVWDRPQPDRHDWRCDYRIFWPGGEISAGCAYGVDSAQALVLSLYQVGGRLETADMPVRWLDNPENELGLPSFSHEETTGDAP